MHRLDDTADGHAKRLVALARLAATNLGDPVDLRGTPGDRAAMARDSIAITRGHGHYRLGLVTKTTPGKITVAFLTASGITEAGWRLDGFGPTDAARLLTTSADDAALTLAIYEQLPHRSRALAFAKLTATPRPRAEVFEPREDLSGVIAR